MDKSDKSTKSPPSTVQYRHFSATFYKKILTRFICFSRKNLTLDKNRFRHVFPSSKAIEKLEKPPSASGFSLHAPTPSRISWQGHPARERPIPLNSPANATIGYPKYQGGKKAKKSKKSQKRRQLKMLQICGHSATIQNQPTENCPACQANTFVPPNAISQPTAC
jgi:hypothetical protein